MGLLDQLQAYISANTPRSTRPKVNPAQVIDDGLLGGTVGRIPSNAKAMYQGLLNAPAELSALASPEMTQQVNQAMNQPKAANPQQWLDAGMELSGMAPIGGLMAHTVYHGSPHKFDKFDMSKIGTGEGAQAYGHGLYMAEEPAVANEYRRTLRNMNPSYDGIELNDTVRKTAAEILLKTKGDKAAAMKEAENYAFDNLLIPHIEKMDASKLSYGNLYKVDIPDESIPRMLDWDAAIADQPDNVKAVLQKMGLNVERVARDDSAVEAAKEAYRANPTRDNLNAMTEIMNSGRNEFGKDAYRKMHELAILSGKAQPAKLKEAQVVEQLRKAGIPGIRYLDGNSRGVGGTSNFVLFDDQLPRILEVNGQPTGLLSWADEAKKAKKK